MPTIRYKNAAGKRVPGTTTIISRFKDSGGLIHWAWQQGIDGKDYRATRDGAADIGTFGHSMVEACIHEQPIPEPPEIFDKEQVAAAWQGLQAFKEWKEQTKLRITQTELNLVSEQYQYGGCPDWIGMANGKAMLADYKTSNATYAEGLLQIAAYDNLLTENGICVPERWYVLRTGRDYGDFHHHSIPEVILKKAWKAFVHMRRLYPLMAELKKVAS